MKTLGNKFELHRILHFLIIIPSYLIYVHTRTRTPTQKITKIEVDMAPLKFDI